MQSNPVKMDAYCIKIACFCKTTLSQIRQRAVIPHRAGPRSKNEVKTEKASEKNQENTIFPMAITVSTCYLHPS